MRALLVANAFLFVTAMGAWLTHPAHLQLPETEPVGLAFVTIKRFLPDQLRF